MGHSSIIFQSWYFHFYTPFRAYFVAQSLCKQPLKVIYDGNRGAYSRTCRFAARWRMSHNSRARCNVIYGSWVLAPALNLNLNPIH